MSETPEDIALPTQEAGVLFRAEMASQNFILGYWKVLVGIVVAGLVGVLVYGQFTAYESRQQRALAAEVAKIEVPILELQRTLEVIPDQVQEADLAKLASAAESLMAVGAENSGPGAAEAFMKAAELHRALGNTDQQLAAYEAAIPHAEGDLVFAAKAARAAVLLDTGAPDASVAAWQELSQGYQGYLGAFATLQLARTQEATGDVPGAIASYEALMANYADSELATTASDARAALGGTAAPVQAPAPTEAPAPVEEPGPEDAP